MRSAPYDLKCRSGLRPQRLIRALIGVGCVRMALALPAASGPFGASVASAAVQCILCAGSLILLALLDWDVLERLPGIGSLYRKSSYAALAGSLLLIAASLRLFIGLDAVQAFAAALAGLALTLLGLMPLEWLLRDIRLDGPLPCESVVVARLGALQEIVAGSAWGREPVNCETAAGRCAALDGILPTLLQRGIRIETTSANHESRVLAVDDYEPLRQA